MGRRLCKETALKDAIKKKGFTHLFGSALMRYRRGELLFAIVGNADGLQAVTYLVESLSPERIILGSLTPPPLNEPEIAKWLRKAAERKQRGEWVEFDEHTLRHLASQACPGSLFYDTFVDKVAHVFNVLPPTQEKADVDSDEFLARKTPAPAVSAA